MTPADVDTHLDTAAAYVHIPFCSAVCPYCDFAVVAGADDLTGRYARAVVAEIEMSAPWRPLEAIYFGGGTPSHVAPALLGMMLDALAGHHGIADGAEISLEANPEDFRRDRAADLRSLGFNRVSFGAQSLDGAVLESLGRRHDSTQVTASISTAREAGFENVSVDLIYGTPGETAGSWVDTVAGVVGLGPDHMSCYALTVEPGTPLGRAVRDGADAPDPDAQADRYEHAVEALGNAGLHHYEVSNWARPDKTCRYNLTVWAQGEFEAYGNGAHRFRDGSRSRNLRHLGRYLDCIDSGESPVTGEDRLAGWALEIDRLFVGLRRRAGVAAGPGVDALVSSAVGKRLLEAAVIEIRGDRLLIARPLLTDEVHRAVLDLEAPARWSR
jgi:putative oxygen-independent coproporphyrinogen III oxidase